ncbi:MAG: phospholipid carrier-dependent glycosyltransferase, partial [Candidatus Binatia bacterium]|nr:phospholipid carrier-dependent glycosyltransferase [Candidatus Binatia bacterium]
EPRHCIWVLLRGLSGSANLTLSVMAVRNGAPLGDVAALTSINMVVAALALLASLFFLYFYIVRLPERRWLGLLIWSLILLILICEIVLGLLPPVLCDELTHHLALPKLYAKEGKIFSVPFAPYSYYPNLLDMLYTPFVKWGWDSIPKLVHGLYALLTGLLLYAYCARRLNTIYGLLAFFFYISTPAVLRLSHYAYVDLGITFYATASLLCFLQWIDSDRQTKWLLLSGLSSGFALATKPNGLLVFFLLFSLVVFSLGRERERGLGHLASWTSLFIIFAMIPYSPWLLKNLSQTGNPFFPFFMGFFTSGGGGTDTGGGVGGGGYGLLANRAFLYGESGWDIAALPLRVFFSGQLVEGLFPERWGSVLAAIGGRDNAARQFDGVLSPILILFLPWVFKGKWMSEKRFLFVFALLNLLFVLFLVDVRIRYILPIVPALVILLVYGLHNIYLRMVHPTLLVCVVLVLVLLNGVYLGRTFESVSPIPYLTGRESREDYLSRMMPDYPVNRYINRKLPATAKIYFILMGQRVYYTDLDYIHDPGTLPWQLLQMIRGGGSAEDLKTQFRGKGLTHLLVREQLLRRFLADNLSPREKMIWDSFATRYLIRDFSERGYTLYQIHD